MGVVDTFIEHLVKGEGMSVHDLFPSEQIKRAIISYVEIMGQQEDIPDDGMAFVVGHCLGEIDALRRAKLALSDPRARGVEREALGHLAEGWSIEDALRKARASPPSAEKAGNVIQLPRRR